MTVVNLKCLLTSYLECPVNQCSTSPNPFRIRGPLMGPAHQSLGKMKVCPILIKLDVHSLFNKEISNLDLVFKIFEFIGVNGAKGGKRGKRG